MLFVHEGTGVLGHGLRADPLRPGRLPGPADRHDLAPRPRRRRRPADALPRVPVRDRAAEALPQRLRPAPRALAVLAARHPGARATAPPRTDEGDFGVLVKMRGRLTAYHYATHPFDVVGWDGYLWPFAFNIADFEPITGRVHQPPPVHQTFAARNFVVCSFVPRKFDYHPLAIPAPYNHSNINSDEVIYYVAGNFMSRRGVGISSFTLHPAGIPHGPHPGTAEASIGKEATEELAVMVDTFHPLRITRQAAALEDARYPYSWLPAEDASGEARELARARAGGVPGLTRQDALISCADQAGSVDEESRIALDLGMQGGILDDGFLRVDDEPDARRRSATQTRSCRPTGRSRRRHRAGAATSGTAARWPGCMSRSTAPSASSCSAVWPPMVPFDRLRGLDVGASWPAAATSASTELRRAAVEDTHRAVARVRVHVVEDRQVDGAGSGEALEVSIRPADVPGPAGGDRHRHRGRNGSTPYRSRPPRVGLRR